MATYTNTVAATADILAALGTASIASNDSLYFTHNDDTYTGSLNQAAKDVLLINAGAEFKGNVGGSGGSFQLDCYQTGSGKILIGFGGDYWYQGFGSGSARHALIEFDPFKPGAKLVLNGTGQVDRLVIKRGYCQVADTADVDELYAWGGETYLVYHASNTTTDIKFCGPAKVTIERDFTNAYLPVGATLVVDKTTVTPASIKLDGGRLDYNGGNITTMLAEQGDLDWSRLKGPITITNLTITEQMNGRVKRPPSGIVITVTNLTQIGQNVDKWWA